MRLLYAVVLAASACSAQSVQGTVTNSMTGAGIAGASVSLEAGKKTYDATTDATGVYRIQEVPAGEYRASFSARGFLGPLLTSPVTRQVKVEGSQVTVDIKLAPAAKVSGRVTDSEGKPVAGSHVALTVAKNSVAEDIETGPDGRFQFNRVSPGLYILSATPPADMKPPPKRGDEVFGWVETFFPNASARSLAATITVEAGWELGGQDIHMSPVALHRIRGNVADSSGQPTAGATVGFVNTEDVHARQIVATSSENGTFESAPLPDATWRVSASVPGDAKKQKAFAVQNLGGRDAGPVDLRMEPPFAVQGKLEVPNGSDQSGGCVILAPAEGGSGDEIVNGCPGTREISFFPVFRRSYVITPLVFPKDSGYLESIMIGEREVTGEAVELSPGTPPIHITFKASGGALRGTVAECSGATIIAIPREPALRQVYFRLVRRAACNDSGAFEMTHMRPGEYFVYAFDRAPTAPNPFSELDQSLLNSARTAKIVDGETSDVELRVTPWPQ